MSKPQKQLAQERVTRFGEKVSVLTSQLRGLSDDLDATCELLPEVLDALMTQVNALDDTVKKRGKKKEKKPKPPPRQFQLDAWYACTTAASPAPVWAYLTAVDGIQANVVIDGTALTVHTDSLGEMNAA